MISGLIVFYDKNIKNDINYTFGSVNNFIKVLDGTLLSI